MKTIAQYVKYPFLGGINGVFVLGCAFLLTLYTAGPLYMIFDASERPSAFSAGLIVSAYVSWLLICCLLSSIHYVSGMHEQLDLEHGRPLIKLWLFRAGMVAGIMTTILIGFSQL